MKATPERIKSAKKESARKPRRHRVDRTVEEIRFGFGRSSLGSIVVAFSDRGIVSIRTGQTQEELLFQLERHFPAAHLVPAQRDDLKLVARVVAYVEKPTRGLDLPLDLRGTAFQKRVWKAVMEIPAGHTSTYTEIARQIGAPKAIRAVGNACANNLFAFAVPCYRVLRSDGTFRGKDLIGPDRQRTLLEREIAAEFQDYPTPARPREKRKA